MATAGAPATHPFRRRHRLSRSLDYRAVFDAKVSSRHGPLIVYTKPNGLPHCRLGLSVGRRVGNAVVRNAVKRRLREGFRLIQGDLGDGLDVVVAVRPHRVMPMARYRELLDQALARGAMRWRKRADPEPSP